MDSCLKLACLVRLCFVRRIEDSASDSEQICRDPEEDILVVSNNSSHVVEFWNLERVPAGI
jgi:hypothetical protein